ncbi:MAG TPA: hypothetical protein VFG80_10815 [Myxococcota bacterium]|nr:hypothetical protein [Myxococcota bacterium]
MDRRLGTWRVGLAVLAAALALAACRTPSAPDTLLGPEETAAESRPLGGQSLAQRKQELDRAWRDLVHFHATLESLRHRKDRNGFVLFSGFVDAYMGTHLDPLIEPEWQSEHPELQGLDANVRLVQAELLMHLRNPQRMQRALNEIERRYAGRGEMLVDYPVGEQSRLADAIENLTTRKWRG